MRRPFTTLATLSLSALALAALVGCRSSVRGAATPACDHALARGDTTWSSPITVRDLRVMYRNLQGEEGGWAVGFFKPDTNEFLRWRGVVLERDWIQFGGFQDPPTLIGDGWFTEVLIDPPLDYYVVGDHGFAEPGYYDARYGLFRWKGVRFDPDRVPATVLGMFRKVRPEFVRDIEVPAHRRPLAHCLNLTRGTTGDARQTAWHIREPGDAAVDATHDLDDESASGFAVLYIWRGEGAGWNVGHYDDFNAQCYVWEGVASLRISWIGSNT